MLAVWVSGGAAAVRASVLGHVLAAEDAEAAELHAVLAWLNDDQGGAVLCLLRGDDIARLEAPVGDGALQSGVPCAEPCLGLWVGVGRTGGR